MPIGVYKRKPFTEEHKKNISISKTGEKNPSYKGDDIGYQQIHNRAHQVDPKPVDGKCAICNQVADKKGITELVHSNKDHTYKMPINPDEWWWIHESCHKRYDAKTSWTSKRKKEQSEMMKKNHPMKKPEVVAKMLKTREKNRAKKLRKSKSKKDTSQVSYWLS